MDFEQLLKDLKADLIALAKDKYNTDGNEIIKDMETYLKHSKEKLKKWSTLFVQGAIDKDELAWLLKSQKDLLTLKALQSVGISKISLGHFKNSIVDTVLDRIITHTN